MNVYVCTYTFTPTFTYSCMCPYDHTGVQMHTITMHNAPIPTKRMYYMYRIRVFRYSTNAPIRCCIK